MRGTPGNANIKDEIVVAKSLLQFVESEIYMSMGESLRVNHASSNFSVLNGSMLSKISLFYKFNLKSLIYSACFALRFLVQNLI